MDTLLHPIRFLPPLAGLLEGLEPSLEDAFYPPVASPALSNIRGVNGLWQTRLGLSLFDPDANAGTTSFATTGFVGLLKRHYRDDGAVYNLAAVAGNLRQHLSSDPAFANATNGTGFSSTNVWNSVTLNDYEYWTDRAAALKRWDPTNGVTAVAQPARPSAAPRVKPWTYAILDAWTGAEPFGWAETDGTNFYVEEATALSMPIPGNLQQGRTVHLHADASGSKDDIIRKDATYALASSAIAFWVESTKKNWQVALEIGQNVPGEVSFPLGPFPEKDEAYPYFALIGDLTSLAYLRFKNRKTPAEDQKVFLSPLVLPGRLQGLYRHRYTHYDPTTGEESEPSDISNGGQPTDLSTIGTNFKAESAKAFMKSIMMDFTSDAGTDAATTKIRIYRNGGVPSLTKDSRGQDVWLRVGEVFDQSTTISGTPAAAALSFVVAAATNLAVGDWLVLAKGTATEEYVKIKSIAGTTITIAANPSEFGDTPLQYAHTNGQAVQIAFLDNVSNQALAGSVNTIDAERDDPPAGAHWIDKAPDGRLWIFRYTNRKLGVAVSNRATVERPSDHEVFPDGVNPLVRGHPTQGWRFDVSGDGSGDEIMWGGFFNGIPTVLTKTALYQIDAYAQDQWSPTSVRKVLEIGCLAGETVQVLNDTLIWVAPGPRVVSWTGRGEPKDLTYRKLTTTFSAAPAAYWTNWFARARADENGADYWLFLTPSGGTTNTKVLRYNFLGDEWEPYVFNTGADLAWANAVVFDGGNDDQEFLAAHVSSGNAYFLEEGASDNGTAITFSAKTKRQSLPGHPVFRVERVWLRGDAAADTLTVTVKVGGSEYGDQSAAYAGIDFTGTGDKEKLKRTAFRTLVGRWVEVTLSGSSDDSLALREVVVDVSLVRPGRLTA